MIEEDFDSEQSHRRTRSWFIAGGIIALLVLCVAFLYDLTPVFTSRAAAQRVGKVVRIGKPWVPQAQELERSGFRVINYPPTTADDWNGYIVYLKREPMIWKFHRHIRQRMNLSPADSGWTWDPSLAIVLLTTDSRVLVYRESHR